jgi:hypothetical protein
VAKNSKAPSRLPADRLEVDLVKAGLLERSERL